MLRTAGLQESDVTLASAPAMAMAAALAKGEADAMSMWEPESENAARAIGTDAIVFQDNTVYRELYSVYSTTRTRGREDSDCSPARSCSA
jgi:NitT/TauT family transport system substrate-binding protein